MRSHLRLLSAVLLALLLLASHVSSSALERASLPPSAAAPPAVEPVLMDSVNAGRDASVCEGFSAGNYGTYPDIYVGSSFCPGSEAIGTQVGFVWFNVALIPAGKVINRATLNMRLSSSDGTATASISASRAASTWTETGVTWSNAPVSAGDGPRPPSARASAAGIPGTSPRRCASGTLARRPTMASASLRRAHGAPSVRAKAERCRAWTSATRRPPQRRPLPRLVLAHALPLPRRPSPQRARGRALQPPPRCRPQHRLPRHLRRHPRLL